MNRRMMLGFFVLMLVFVLMSCSAKDLSIRDEDNDFDDDTVTLDNESVPDRKIIYTVEGTLYVTDLETANQTLKGFLEADEWIDKEVVDATTMSLVMRIKSDRLDAFLGQIDQTYDISNLTRTATDISLDYQDVSAHIDALETERTTLVALMTEDRSFSEILLINDRLTDINLELGELTGERNLFDSLSDYSTVTLSVRESRAPEEVTFIREIVDGFSNGVGFVISFFKGLVIAIVTIFPVALIGAPIGYVIYKIIKKIDHKTTHRKTNDENKGNDTPNRHD